MIKLFFFGKNILRKASSRIDIYILVIDGNIFEDTLPTSLSEVIPEKSSSMITKREFFIIFKHIFKLDRVDN